MARQAGLGKSLHEVLEALTPAETLPEVPRRAREQLEQDLDELIEQVQALRAEVRQLARATAGATRRDDARTEQTTTKKKKKKKNKKKKKKKKNEK